MTHEYELETAYRYVMSSDLKAADVFGDGTLGGNWREPRILLAKMVEKLESLLASDRTFEDDRCRNEIKVACDTAKSALAEKSPKEPESAYRVAAAMMIAVRAMLRVTTGEYYRDGTAENPNYPPPADVVEVQATSGVRMVQLSQAGKSDGQRVILLDWQQWDEIVSKVAAIKAEREGK